MRPLLVCAAAGETRIEATVGKLAHQLALTQEERADLLPSSQRARLDTRVNLAKAYRAKAGPAKNTRRGCVRITPRGQAALADAAATINNAYLDQFKEFQDFKAKVNEADGAASGSAAAPVAFSQPAIDTARGLGSRIVLIDGLQLSRLMIRYNVGCRDEEVLHLKKVDEDFFEG